MLILPADPNHFYSVDDLQVANGNHLAIFSNYAETRIARALHV